MLQTDEIIIYFSPYSQISQHVNLENHNKTCPSLYSTTVVCITLQAQQISDKQKILYPVQVTMTDFAVYLLRSELLVQPPSVSICGSRHGQLELCGGNLEIQEAGNTKVI